MSTLLKVRPVSTPEMLAKAEKLRESAARSAQAAEDSFQRSDTDGFLSQWAHIMGSQVANANIGILENGGVVAVRVLCNEAGEIISEQTRTFPNKHAPWTSSRVWDLGPEANVKYGRRFVPMQSYQGKSRIQKQFKFHEEERFTPGYAKTTAPAGARGLGGCASAYVGRFRSDTNEEV